MARETNSRLGVVMNTLGLSAIALSCEVGISNSLISRWQKGSRKVPQAGPTSRLLAEALVRLDTEDILADILAPYDGPREKTITLQRYLTEDNLTGFMPETMYLQRSGEYIAQQQVLLGARGFRKSCLIMLDYLQELDPGQKLIICAHSGFDLWHGSITFALQILKRIPGIMKHKTTITLITRNAEGFDGSHYFSVHWLVLQLRKILQIRYYEGEPPYEYYVANIRGKWSGRVEPDPTAEDGITTTVYYDPRNFRYDEAHCDSFMRRSKPAGQFAFLKNPAGNRRNKRLWRPGPPPPWAIKDAPAPTGSFSTITRLPALGTMTRAEWKTLTADDQVPELPDYLFAEDDTLLSGPHRLIFCKEDVREALVNGGPSLPLSILLGREVILPPELVAAQLQRLLDTMRQNPGLEVALMPKVAFDKLELEFIHWHHSVALGWLQDRSQSLFTDDMPTCRGFANAANNVWNRLHKGWWRKKNVRPTLRKWLAGEGLGESDEDSMFVKAWRVMPRK